MPRLKAPPPRKLDELLKQSAGLRPDRAVRWVREHLPDFDARAVGHAVDHSGRDIADWLQARLSRAERRAGGRRAPDAAAVLWPTFLAAAGAGAAFWWWTQWSRGRAEAERDRLGGEEGAAHPQDILAHAPPPPHGASVADPAPAADAPEAILAHAPSPGEAKGGKGKLKKVKPVVAPKAEEALRRNLAVQAVDPPAARPVRKDLQ